MNDKEFGQRVRQLRESASMTREQFCDDELELSVRQLTRIEAGTSKPTFSKIQYIATRLGMGLYELMPDYVSLPERYSKLKFDVLRTPTYGNEDLAEKRDAMMTEIYDDYYDELPEEEKIVVDTLCSLFDVLDTDSQEYGKEILDDYLHQSYHRSKLSINDLMILRLFIEHCQLEDLSVGTSNYALFTDLIEKLPQSIYDVHSESLFIVRDLFLAIVRILFSKELYDHIPVYIEKIENIMELSQDFQKKPILNLVKWKYELKVQHNHEIAERYYNEAITFASLLNQFHLKEKLQMEWEKDTQSLKR
ncbi:TPA: helix-turn-helix domain-containing protein [Streptococcus suis]|uniref:Helix-turn-helix transcriptional regulator n=1 Tax=Streptococcus suis TaxID=1307 RepID=A0A0Z8LAV1_STRSU|nr:helix-turn-helix domain-containing protein [Streptococcus suis]MBO4131796.1 helix-turn-helix domain-containing protein [Streptococcus suis]MBO4133784.1 helix-turn-helix domain-containing protein [Streptococcus suis]MCK3848433.1 helix-turn-helix transcriptional regulator [Streptococcus suis]MCK3907603.1 helix-turn-helix transcriptional regulator [Streptococcus suis]MCK3959457.1 helix-turn-helix transcriptional regulator [Streptococcus suis]